MRPQPDLRAQYERCVAVCSVGWLGGMKKAVKQRARTVHVYQKEAHTHTFGLRAFVSGGTNVLEAGEAGERVVVTTIGALQCPCLNSERISTVRTWYANAAIVVVPPPQMDKAHTYGLRERHDPKCTRKRFIQLWSMKDAYLFSSTMTQVHTYPRERSGASRNKYQIEEK